MNPIIESSIEMRVNGVLVPHTASFPEPHQADIQYQVTEAFAPDTLVAVNVKLVDAVDYAMDYTWCFLIGEDSN